jgi:hypothetical protein
MATRRIQCITKLPNHQDRHRRIQAVGGSEGGRWKDSEETAIANVKRDPNAYNVTEQGKTVKVIVKKHDSRDYLKTENDRFLPDNLLSLPERPCHNSRSSQRRCNENSAPRIYQPLSYRPMMVITKMRLLAPNS